MSKQLMYKKIIDINNQVLFTSGDSAGNMPTVDIAVDAKFVYDAITTIMRTAASEGISEDEVLSRCTHPKKEFPKPVRVIFNGPATIVFFEDGTKSVAKCAQCSTCVRNTEGDNIIQFLNGLHCGLGGYSKRIGILTALAKRAYGLKESGLKGLIESGNKR